MKDFAAIDFEAANEKMSSVCSVGVVIVRNGEITERLYRLIRPKPNYYHWGNSRVNKLSRKDTDSAPNFKEVWKEIGPKIEGLPLVAHSSPMDEHFLKAAFAAYRMRYPGYQFYCTLKASQQAFPDAPNHQLPTIAALCGYTMVRHHNALEDAEACAWIAREILLG